MKLKEKIKLRLEFLNTKKDSWGQANIDDRKYEIGLILSELEKMKCKWILLDEDCSFYEADCGYAFTLNSRTLKENEFYFCPKCGRKIIELKE
jgi:hypothetical protein